MKEKAKMMQISAKIHQKYAKLCKKKNKPVFGYKTLVLLKKRSLKIGVSTYESVQ